MVPEYPTEYRTEVVIDSSPQIVWECLTDPVRITRWGQAPALFDPTDGGHFEVFRGGSIRGHNVLLDPPRRLTQKWQFSSWGDLFSDVQFDLTVQHDERVLLHLEQWNIPRDFADLANSWHLYYLNPLRVEAESRE